jgi:hypothetical protein
LGPTSTEKGNIGWPLTGFGPTQIPILRVQVRRVTTWLFPSIIKILYKIFIYLVIKNACIIKNYIEPPKPFVHPFLAHVGVLVENYRFPSHFNLFDKSDREKNNLKIE